MTAPRVTLLSDFGTVDGYAAAMAGVIAAAAPAARIESASHDIPPGHIRTAALTLSRYAFLYPEETVHLVVVDPGVGTDRRALAGRIDGRYFVAPDNGVLSRVLHEARDVELVALRPDPHTAADGSERRTSATFHGRDVFAPAAGRLASGSTLESLGSPVTDPVRLPLPGPTRAGDEVSGEVIEVDRFGNLVTSIPESWIPGGRVYVEGRGVGPVRRTYGDVGEGELLALVGSLGLLEVSVRDGSAADRLDVGRGARVTVRGVSSRATLGRRG